MEWIEVFVATSQMGLEPVEGVLYQCGLNGLMIHDEADFAEFLENPNREWDYVADELVEEKQEQTTGITFFLRDNLYGREQLSQIKSALQSVKETEKELDLGSLEVTMKNVAEEDWANNWKKYFNPIEVGEKLLIRPSWRDDYDAGNRKVLNIDPGLAFGTGGHETTRLCLEMCEKYLKEGDSVLDVGCGSGILGIATLLLGADRAVGVDIDETAVRTAAENAEINGVADRFTAICGSFTDKVEGKYDIVLANIVADAIMFLSKGIKDFMKDDAVYIMSGIIDTRAEEVKASVSQYFDIIEEHLDNGWACFAARRAAVPRS